jgi:Leucine-rich repeat (LRR) protein
MILEPGIVEKLDVGYSDVDESIDIATITLSNLEELDVRTADITNSKPASELSTQFKNLRAIRVRYGFTSQKCIIDLIRATSESIEEVILYQCGHDINYEQLVLALSECKRLKYFDIGSRYMTLGIYTLFSEDSSIEKLKICNGTDTNTNRDIINGLSNLTKLKKIEFYDCNEKLLQLMCGVILQSPSIQLSLEEIR